jgi:hypothetical protein
MALAWAIMGGLVGIALGLRFKVFVLAPATGFAEICALTFGIARSDSFWTIVLTMVIAGAAIQLGYLLGIFLVKPSQ